MENERIVGKKNKPISLPSLQLFPKAQIHYPPFLSLVLLDKKNKTSLAEFQRDNLLSPSFEGRGFQAYLAKA